MASILVIDDDEGVRRLLRQVLESEGHEVHVAGDGARGVARYRDVVPDLTIVDLLMPEKDGLETIGEIRELAPEARIIAMTGALPLHEPSLKVAERLGAAHTLRKPMSVDEILLVVEEALR